MKIRQEMRFYGTVQGVGFRYTAKCAAQSLGLTGWVYNDYDGSVLMQVQGEKETIDKLISIIENRRFVEIEQLERKNLPLEPSELDFSVHDSF